MFSSLTLTTASEPVIVPESESAPRRVHSPTDPAIVLVVEIFQVYHHIVVLADPESAANPAGQEAGNVSEQRGAGDARAEHAVLNLGQRLAGRSQQIVRRAEPAVGARRDQSARTRAAREEVGDGAARTRRARAAVFDVERRQLVLTPRAIKIRLDPITPLRRSVANAQPALRGGRSAFDVRRKPSAPVFSAQPGEVLTDSPVPRDSQVEFLFDAMNPRVAEIGADQDGVGRCRTEDGVARVLRRDELIAQP